MMSRRDDTNTSYFIFSQYGKLGQFSDPGARFCGSKLSVLLPSLPCKLFNCSLPQCLHLLRESEICSVVTNSFQPHGLYSPWNSPGQNTGGDSCSFSKGSSQRRDRIQISCIAGGFFTV